MNLRACLDCGVPCKGPRCDHHAKLREAHARRRRKAFGLTGSRGSTHASRKRREQVLDAAGRRCYYCSAPATIGEHYVPLANGGEDTAENMVASCRPCNQAKGTQTPEQFMASAWLRHRRESLKQSIHIIAIVGAPAAGKTWVRERVAKQTGINHKAIDQCGPPGQREYRWSEMLRWLRQQEGVAIVESNVIPREFAERLRTSSATVIEVTAPNDVREKRLAKRGGRVPKRFPVRHPIDMTVGASQASVDRIVAVVEAARTTELVAA